MSPESWNLAWEETMSSEQTVSVRQEEGFPSDPESLDTVGGKGYREATCQTSPDRDHRCCSLTIGQCSWSTGHFLFEVAGG